MTGYNRFSFLKRTKDKSYHRSMYNAINAHVTLNLVCTVTQWIHQAPPRWQASS